MGCLIAFIAVAFLWSFYAGLTGLVWFLLSLAFETPGPSLAGCYAIGIAFGMVRGIFNRGSKS